MRALAVTRHRVDDLPGAGVHRADPSGFGDGEPELSVAPLGPVRTTTLVIRWRRVGHQFFSGRRLEADQLVRERRSDPDVAGGIDGDPTRVQGPGRDLAGHPAVVVAEQVDVVRVDLVDDPETLGCCLKAVWLLAWRHPQDARVNF